MTNLTRKNQKVFASGASNNGQFGSLQATTKVLSNDVETLQALAAYEAGWNSAIVSGEQLPSLEEFQGLNYINTYQIGYLLQKGIPEWIATATYYDGDIQRGVGNSKLYQSEIDDNTNLSITATAYDGGTTYNTGDVASDTNGDVYQSLTDSNTGNPLSDGANWEIVWKYLGDLSEPEPVAGNSVQVVQTQTGAVATGTTIIPEDNTKPQNTEGDEYMTLAITPTKASNKLKIDVVFNGTHSVTALLIVALFQDSTADAIAVSAQVVPTSVYQQNISFSHYMTAGTTSTTTFKVRAGGRNAGTTTFNGSGGSARFDGTFASSITITEIEV